MARFKDNYGAGPLHLLSAVAMGAIVLYALLEIAGANEPLDFAIWFVAAVIAHDMISFPLYSILGVLAGGVDAKTRPGTVNYIRVPAFLSAIAFIVWFPFILGVDADYFEEKTGVAPDGYFTRWLLLIAVLALGSALLYAINTRRHRGKPPMVLAGEPPLDVENPDPISAGDGPVKPERVAEAE